MASVKFSNQFAAMMLASLILFAVTAIYGSRANAGAQSVGGVTVPMGDTPHDGNLAAAVLFGFSGTFALIGSIMSLVKPQ